VQTIGSHLVYLVEIRNITLSQQGHGLIYFKRRFHPVMMEWTSRRSLPSLSRGEGIIASHRHGGNIP
jgi:flavin reductase (DIM6/NTAB) family NADH-FMN oxidoreductase RutF